MVPVAAPSGKLRVGGRSRRKAGFCRWKRPVSGSLHRGLSAPGYDFALGNEDELVSYSIKKSRKIATRYYAHANHLYSVAAVTSSTGSVVERWSYNAYGVPTIKNSAGATLAKSGVGNDRGFTGYKLDSETGLYFARARMYSAKLGRFISRDMVKTRPYDLRPSSGDGYLDGAALYIAYFAPNFLDPMGECSCDCVGKLSCDVTGPPGIFVGSIKVGPKDYDEITDKIETELSCDKKLCTETIEKKCVCAIIFDGKKYIPGGGIGLGKGIPGQDWSKLGKLGKLAGTAYQGALNVSAPHTPQLFIIDQDSCSNSCDCSGGSH